MAITRVFLVSILVAMIAGGCSLLWPTDISVQSVRVSNEGQGKSIEIIFVPCVKPDSVEVVAKEHDDRVVLHIEAGRPTGSDCASQGEVTLSEPLNGRIVVVGSDKQIFEYCGLDFLCREGTTPEDGVLLGNIGATPSRLGRS